MAQPGLLLALTFPELRVIFFVSSQYVYKLVCLPMMILWLSREASVRVSGLTNTESRIDICQLK